MKALTSRGTLCLLFSLVLTGALHAQSSVSIGTDALKDKAVLWLVPNGGQGLLLPSLTTSARTGMNPNSSDEKGMIVYDNQLNKVFYWNGTAWVEAGGGTGANQTLTLGGNTFTLSGSPASNVNLASNTPATGQALVWNGTAWTASSITGDVTGTTSTTQVAGLKGKLLPNLPGSTQALVYDGTNWIFQAISSAGEANTASNVGTAGVGVFKQKTGVNLEFQKINAASNKIAVTADAANSEVDIDVNQANLSIAAAQVTGLGTLALVSTITNTNIAAGANIDITKINSGGVPNDGKVLKVSGGVLTYGTDDVGTGAAILGAGQLLTGNGTTNAATTVTGDLALTGGDLQLKANTVTATELATDAVVTGKILDETITNADIALGANIAITKLNSGGAPNNGKVLKVSGGVLTFGTDDVGTGAAILGAGQLLTGNGTTNTATTVTGDLALTGGDFQLNANTVTATEIAADAVDATKLRDDAATDANRAVTTNHIRDAAITTGKILDGTIATADIANDAIDATKLRDDAATDANRSVTTNHIRDNAIVTSKIADGTIVAADLGAMGASDGDVLKFNSGVWAPGSSGGGGTVTSVGLSLPAIFSVTNSPVTTTGTLTGTLASQTAATVFAAPTGAPGAPTFRALAATDIPALDAAKITTGSFGVARGGTGLTAVPANGQVLIGNGTGYALNTLVEGSGIDITNGAGTITIASTGLANPMAATGDIIYGGAAGVPTALTGAAGFLKSTGAAAPSWAAVNLAGTDVTGTLPLTQGGTGATTAAAARTSLGALATTLNSGQVFVGNAGNVATGVALSGDIASVTNAGLVTIATDAITSGKIDDDAIVNADINTGAAIAGTKIVPAFGTQAISTTGTLTAGAITATNLASINSVTYAWPNTDGATPAFLRNDGTGNLTWAAASGAALSTDNVIPVGDGTTQVASSLTDNGTTVSSAADINLATGKVIKMNNTTVFNSPTLFNLFIGANTPVAPAGSNNTYVGYGAGQSTTSGTENAYFGLFAGNTNTTGSYNTFLGRGAGRNWVTGDLNTIIGYNAGLNSNNYQGTVLIGANAGKSSTAGLNVFVGERAGEQTTTGFQNVFLGRNVGQTHTTGAHNILIGADADVSAGAIHDAIAIGFGAIVGQNNSMVLGGTGANAVKVGIGVAAPAVTFDVVSTDAGNVAEFDRNIGTGTGIIGFYRQGTFAGNISESGGTVSYNPFTGSHFATCAEELELGTLVTMTGKTDRINGDGEPVYGVMVSHTPNDPKLLGSYLHTVDQPESINNMAIRAIMAVGNGIVWVADKGEDIDVGDYLISADVRGHVMKDQGEFEIAYVIARAAEPVQWQQETALINGVKHKRISVFYESFTRNHKAEKLEKEIAELRAEVNSLKQNSQSQMGQLQIEVENLKKTMAAFSDN